MAESQLRCMEDGHIGVKIPDTKPEFYYSEEQRAAIEELLRSGDGAFKTRLREDEVTDFLSAREVRLLQNTFKKYECLEHESGAADSRADADSGLHSTYWPQMSDTEVPPLDLGWPSGGFFKGVTRVTVHTHPPKENGPHIKEVVRRLIQEANKVIAVVMDLLTDVHILQDLMDAAHRRSVPVYILIDAQAVPHFLDMCSRLKMGAQHLRNIRARTLRGIGLHLSFGRLPGSLCNKYMLVDGDKVMFGSYSFSWSSARMDRNMITVMTGQVVDFFDQDFRELYAVSEKLDLFKEFHINAATASTTSTLRSKVGPKRPPLPATTSRFQVSLGDSRNAEIQVPAHKYYNPKYSLVFGDAAQPSAFPTPKKQSVLAIPEESESEKLDRLTPLPTDGPSEIFRNTGTKKEKKTWKQRLSRKKSSSKLSVNSMAESTTQSTAEIIPDQMEDDFVVVPKNESKRKSRREKKTSSTETVNTAQDSQSVRSGHHKKTCTVS
ncbi:protein FAM83F-like [Synchiropus splendidus]|uniref:protein FAM83F-like n=1 Tax=Synchiropus splendidus TaxID=270530 RepID=UPI00237D43FC|nr:protein FAM83F-like [Synchiropus splendidus]